MVDSAVCSCGNQLVAALDADEAEAPEPELDAALAAGDFVSGLEAVDLDDSDAPDAPDDSDEPVLDEPVPDEPVPDESELVETAGELAVEPLRLSVR